MCAACRRVRCRHKTGAMCGSQKRQKQSYDVSTHKHRLIIFSCALQGICESLSCSSTEMKQENLTKNKEEAHETEQRNETKKKNDSRNSFSTRLFAFPSLPSNRQGIAGITCAIQLWLKRWKTKNNEKKLNRIRKNSTYARVYKWFRMNHGPMGGEKKRSEPNEQNKRSNSAKIVTDANRIWQFCLAAFSFSVSHSISVAWRWLRWVPDRPHSFVLLLWQTKKSKRHTE